MEGACFDGWERRNGGRSRSRGRGRGRGRSREGESLRRISIGGDDLNA